MSKSLRRRPSAAALWLVGLFVAIPAAMFGLPAAFGNTWLVGDNLIQNFPLRVLVGTDLSHLHLPLWNPFLWSGTPLLAGFSAGAAYPFTALFAVLPAALAWTTNQVVVEFVAASGMLVLLRFLGRSWLASALGAGAFAYGGFMAAQSVHLDAVQGASWIPWAFVALDRLAHRPADTSAAPWVGLLGAAIGLSMLSGSTEPLLDSAIAMVIFVVWLLWRTPARRRSIFFCSAAGVALGALTAGAQLFPGALFQAQSQRAAETYRYFSSGSLNKSLTILGLDPTLLGGAHGYPISYFGTYNLPEISSYLGIFAAMGLFGLLARRHRVGAKVGRWWIWYVIFGVGLLFTWGGFTPFGHVMYEIPLFNRQRLLNRNILVVDLALAVILATWIDAMFLSPRTKAAVLSDPAIDRESDARGAPRRRRWTSDVVLPLIAPVAVIALQIVLVIGGTWFPHFLHVPGRVTDARLAPLVAFLTIPSAIALAAIAIVIFRRRLGRRLPNALVGLMVIDLVVFNAVIQVAPDSHAATSSTSQWANELAATVAADGGGGPDTVHRVAVYDPDRFYPVEVNHLGQPDLDIVRSIPTVQGYGALVDGGYDAVTGTHTQLSLKASQLDDGTLAGLDLGVLVSVPEYFVHLVAPPPNFTKSMQNGAVHLPPGPPSSSSATSEQDDALAPPTPLSDFATVAAPSSTLPVRAGKPETMYFGTVLSVTDVEIPLTASTHGTVSVGLLSADGRRTTWIGTASATGSLVSIHTTHGIASSGMVVKMTSPDAGVFGAPVLRTAGQGVYRVDGSLRDIVTSPRWIFVRMIGIFPTFEEVSSGQAWVVGGHGQVHVVSNTTWGTESIKVTTTTAATVVRDEAYASGWLAQATPGGSVAVTRRGLVQSVHVPAGTHLITFFYRPHRVDEGFAASAAGVIAIAGLELWPRFVRRRRRRQPRSAD